VRNLNITFFTVNSSCLIYVTNIILLQQRAHKIQKKIPEISKLRQLVFKRIEAAVNGPGFKIYKIKGFSCNRMLISKVLVIDGN